MVVNCSNYVEGHSRVTKEQHDELIRKNKLINLDECKWIILLYYKDETHPDVFHSCLSNLTDDLDPEVLCVHASEKNIEYVKNCITNFNFTFPIVYQTLECQEIDAKNNLLQVARKWIVDKVMNVTNEIPIVKDIVTHIVNSYFEPSEDHFARYYVIPLNSDESFEMKSHNVYKDDKGDYKHQAYLNSGVLSVQYHKNNMFDHVKRPFLFPLFYPICFSQEEERVRVHGEDIEDAEYDDYEYSYYKNEKFVTLKKIQDAPSGIYNKINFFQNFKRGIKDEDEDDPFIWNISCAYSIGSLYTIKGESLIDDESDDQEEQED